MDFLSAENLAAITRLEEQALRAMRQVENPVWRRHLEDLAAACDTVLACASRLVDSPTGSHTDNIYPQGKPDELRCQGA